MRPLRFPVSVLIGALLLPGPIPAQVVTGRVADELSGPVSGAFVALLDDRGRFLLVGLPGHRYRVVIDHPGLEPQPPPTTVTLTRGDTVHLAPGDPR